MNADKNSQIDGKISAERHASGGFRAYAGPGKQLPQDESRLGAAPFGRKQLFVAGGAIVLVIVAASVATMMTGPQKASTSATTGLVSQETKNTLSEIGQNSSSESIGDEISSGVLPGGLSDSLTSAVATAPTYVYDPTEPPDGEPKDPAAVQIPSTVTTEPKVPAGQDIAQETAPVEQTMQEIANDQKTSLLETNELPTSLDQDTPQADTKQQTVTAKTNANPMVDASLSAAAAKSPELANVRARQVFPVSILKVAAHNGFPGAARLADGTIIAVWRGASNHNMAYAKGYVYKSYSKDNGTTWTRPERINTAASLNAGAAGIMVPTYGPLAGRPILTLDERDGSQRGTGKVMVSADLAGFKWSSVQRIQLRNAWRDNKLASPVTQISANKFIISGYSGPRAQSRVMVWTGKGWKLGASATMAYGGPVYSEPNIVAYKRPNGKVRLLGLVRTNSWGRNPLYIRKVFSDNQGASWSGVTNAFPGEGNPHMTVLKDGRVIASYRRWTGSQSQRRPGNMPAVYRVSRDGGSTWGPEVVYGNARSMMSYGMPVEYAPNKVVSVWSQETNGTNAVIQATRINP